jgi:5-methylthioribose kinase
MESIESIIAYVNKTKEWPFVCKLKDLKQLSGGLVNFVYRLTFDDDSTVIFKYFPNYLAVDKSIEMSQSRYFVEKEALKLLGGHVLLRQTHVRIPKLLYFDDENYIIVMQDAGARTKTLFEYLKIQNTDFLGTEETIDFLAKELFNFSKFLNNSGISPATNKIPFENETLWNKLRAYLIPLYSSEAKWFNLEQELGVHIEKANRLLQRPAQNEGCFVYGDLWPSE